jgi:hypothetical protein
VLLRLLLLLLLLPRPAINWRFQLCGLSPSEPMTDMDMPLVPGDMYHHISTASCLGVPLVITETGVADKGGELRARVIREYYGQVS